MFNEAIQFYEKGKYQDSLECFTSILNYYPNNLELLFNKANLLFELGLFNDAINSYNQVNSLFFCLKKIYNFL